jgi:hypothetical protein
VSTLQAEEIMRLTVKVGPPYKVGRVNGGVLQVIPIIGGNVVGSRINGTVVPGGADWNTSRDEGVAHVYAKYVLETHDGEFIIIENEGLIKPGTESIIKTSPRFTANCDGKYQFLNHGVYVGELVSTPNAEGSVDIVIYRMS